MNLKTGQSVDENTLPWSLYCTLLLYGPKFVGAAQARAASMAAEALLTIPKENLGGAGLAWGICPPSIHSSSDHCGTV